MINPWIIKTHDSNRTQWSGPYSWKLWKKQVWVNLQLKIFSTVIIIESDASPWNLDLTSYIFINVETYSSIHFSATMKCWLPTHITNVTAMYDKLHVSVTHSPLSLYYYYIWLFISDFSSYLYIIMHYMIIHVLLLSIWVFVLRDSDLIS